MNFLELAEKRYSVRDYADKNVEEEKLKKEVKEKIKQDHEEFDQE